ncbi:serine hydrolase domain-containing protein [Nitrincola sp. MINF-07-Sa-05]|uniref:serine hydrolase domain-containing protein n=1 Tax=Nitrincola salilacus TaxID=3400273 RepID=UPI0039182EB0
MKAFHPSKKLILAMSAALSCGTFAIQSTQASDINWTSPTLLEGRANMMYPGLNFLTFQHFDQMFSTRTVTAGANVWPLEYGSVDLGDDFELHGERMTLEEHMEQTRGNALMVIHKGKVVHEQYRNGMTPESRHTVYSMSKSIIATLFGIALEEGYIDSLNDPVTKYLPRMAGSGYDGVSVEDVLLMRSGVNWEERYEFGSQTQLTEVHDNAVVGYAYRWCDYAEGIEKLHEPGTHFNYATIDTSILGCILEAATERKVADYMSEKIWQPAGMENDGYWIMDGAEPEGDEFYGAGFNASLRDLGRFGLMMLNQGEANQQQVVSKEWVAASTIAAEGYEPTEPGSPFGYQYQWWTLTDSNAYSAIGLFNQFIYVDPDSQTVIVKLSSPESPLGDEEGNLEFFQQIIDKL